jgi:protocatechuate 3,4-dioxygenase beta subunit
LKKLCPVTLALLLGALPLAALQAPAPRAPSKPTPSPTPAPVLEGAVKGPDGKPVEAALVMARSTAVYSDPPLSTSTDAGGRFRLTLRRGGPHVVRVEAKGLAGATVEKTRPGTPVAVTLTAGTMLEGTVRDGTTGQPVAGARVQARDEMALSSPWEPTAGVAEATTDAKGRFRLQGLTSAPQTVSARVPGLGSGSKSGALPGRPADIYLFPGATLSGTIWGPGDLRVAGAVVRAEPDAPGFRSMPPATVSDAQGRYEIAGLRPGTYRLLARHKDFAPELLSGVLVERGADAQADISLDKGTAIVGRLVAGPEQTVAGRVSVQELDGQPAPPALRDVVRAEAGADGRFRLELMPSGAHVVGVTAPGYASKRVDVHVRPGARDVDLGDVELEAGLTIRGRVHDRAGPIAGAAIRAATRRPMAMNSFESISEADGSFVLAGLEPGAYRVNVYAPGYAATDLPAQAGAERVDVLLAPGGSIAGTVVDDAGRPVDAFQVNANPVQREGMQGGMVISGPRFQSANGTDGRFVIEDLGEGTYVVNASATGRASANVSNLKVSAGSTTDAGTIRLLAGGTVRGTVTDSAGTPVPGAVVSARGPGRDFMFGSEPQGVSDPSGAFEIGGVPAGTVEVVASHPNYADGRASGIEVDPVKGAAEARIVLSQGGRVEGWVRRRDNTGIAGAYVNVMPAPGAGPPPPRSGPGMLVTTADGGFVAEHVPPGRATVTLMTRTGSGYTSAQFQDVEVREGETTPVEMRSRDILVSGRVTRGGAPLSAVRLTLRGERMMMMMFGGGGGEVPAAPAGPQRMTAVTGEDGTYEMIADQPGGARMMVERLDGRGSFPMRMVELPDADAYTLDLAFSGATLAGVVVDRETEQPIARAHVSASPAKPEAGAMGGSRAETGEDGRFQIDLEPGDYKVNAGAENYGRADTEVTVGGAGADEVRLALSRGLTLSGRVIDTRGNGVPGLNVSAQAKGPDGETSSASFVTTLPDGSFQMGGLKDVPHRVVASSDVGLFATREGVSPGDKDVVLTLRPGGRVMVQVVDAEGRPVEGAWATAVEFGMGFRTDARGLVEVMTPAGTVELRANKERLEGRTTVTVAERGTAAAQIVLGPRTRVSRGP